MPRPAASTMPTRPWRSSWRRRSATWNASPAPASTTGSPTWAASSSTATPAPSTTCSPRSARPGCARADRIIPRSDPPPPHGRPAVTTTPHEPLRRVPLESVARLEYHGRRRGRLPFAAGPAAALAPARRKHKPKPQRQCSQLAAVRESKMMTFSKVAAYSRLAAATLALVCTAFALQPSPARAETTLTVVDGIDVKDWDPAVAYGHESYVLNNIYDPLNRYNTKKAKLEPALATSWSASDDGLTWTFKLRPNVKCHSGAPMTAGALKTMLERNIKMNQGAQYLWGGATVTAPDDLTLVIKTKDPLPIDLISSGSYAAEMYSPAAAAAGNAWFQQGHEDGTGPYKL